MPDERTPSIATTARPVIPIVADAGRVDPRTLLPEHVPTGVLRDTLRRPLHDLRISVTDRCNFRCTYCMPKEVFDRDHRYLPHADLLTFEEITRLAGAFVAHGVEKLRLTGGEPLLRKNLERLVGMLAALEHARRRAARPHADDQRLAAPRKARGAEGGGPEAPHRQPRRDRRRAVPRDERRRLRGRRRARRHRRRRRRGLRADQGQHGRQARRQRRPGRADGAALPRHRAHGPLHRVHGRRRVERLDVGRRGPVRRTAAAHRPAVPDRPGRRRVSPARWRRAGATSTAPARSASSRASRSRSAGIARARGCRPRAGSTPACSRATAPTCARWVRGGTSDIELAQAVGAVWAARSDRYSERRASLATQPPRRIEMSYIGG